MWKPHISVWTSRGGSPVSPTTSLGFGVAGVLFLAMIGVGLALMLSRVAIGIVPALLGAAFLKDVWGWFAASEQERGEFLSRVSETRAVVPQNPTIPVSSMMATGATVVFVGAGAMTMVLKGESQVLAMVASLYLGGFSVLCWRDVLRARPSLK